MAFFLKKNREFKSPIDLLLQSLDFAKTTSQKVEIDKSTKISKKMQSEDS
jgi:hypothetical protein